jgi:D-cysteine desulfhydrase/L-cysteate sulfo-lyase
MSIGSLPRFRLAALPTPLHELPRLRATLGGHDRCPRLLIKRDDLTGLAFGGNKARKLEFLTGDALRSGATVLITSGAVQSNHARMTAAAARAGGMGAALVALNAGHAMRAAAIPAAAKPIAIPQRLCPMQTLISPR